MAISTVNTQVTVWRGNDASGNIWASYRNGPPYRLTGQTFDAPVVVPWGAGGFAMFHTGVDNVIYWQTSNSGTENSWSGWVPVRGPDGVAQTTPFGVSAANFGVGHERQLYLAYRSNDNRANIFGAFFDGVRWTNGVNLGGVTGYSPAVTFNVAAQTLYIVHTGVSGEIFYSASRYGSHPGPWFGLGGVVYSRPSIASLDNGRMQIAARGTNDRAWWLELGPYGSVYRDWQEDSSHVDAFNSSYILVVAILNTVVAYARASAGGYIYTKNTWNGQ
ncbi:hypothetical protein [Streptomyces sp. enrichment culture]|uniref:hypothetical protein n=1 Tax=Streptomyces sp. enrichment culture TaxID=1795815 RepID=UPI003F5751D1